MKKLSINISLFFVLLTLSSCNDWLDEVKQTTTVSDEIIWQDETQVDKYVNSFYPLLHDYGQFGEAQFYGSFTESLTDAFKYGSYTLGHRAGHPNLYVLTPDAISPDNCLYSIWLRSTAYKQIRETNQFLSLQRKYSEFSADRNKLWEAQVRFFRAFVYFQLAKRHGGVILYDDLPVSTNKARSSAEETWQFIADDLDFAANNLPKEWDAANKGRITKGAAYALKSRAMLYAKRWQDAYDAANNVIALKLYGLTDKYEDAWKGNNKEAILEFDYDAANGPNHLFDRYYVPQCDGYDNGSTGTPTQEMVECYESKNGEKIDRSNSSQLAKGALPLKYGMDPDMKDGQSGIDVVIYRYADVLLTLAECINRNEGSPTTEAIGLVNRVRKRAGLSELDDAQTASGEAFNEAILLERGHEFYLEGLRRQDLIRFGKYVEYANNRIDAINKSEGRGYFNVHEGHNRFWIPQSFIDESKGAIKQNNYDR